jgi:hypothetical protein
MCYSSDDGPLYTFSDIPAESSSWNCQKLAAEQLLKGQAVRSIKAGGTYQSEGMVLLEYQAMPSLLDVTYDGWWCPFTI